jgi:hypothetical protein
MLFPPNFLYIFTDFYNPLIEYHTLLIYCKYIAKDGYIDYVAKRMDIMGVIFLEK